MLNSIANIYFTSNPSLNPFLDGQSSEIGLILNSYIYTTWAKLKFKKIMFFFHKFPVLKKNTLTTGAAIFRVPK